MSPFVFAVILATDGADVIDGAPSKASRSSGSRDFAISAGAEPVESSATSAIVDSGRVRVGMERSNWIKITEIL